MVFQTMPDISILDNLWTLYDGQNWLTIAHKQIKIAS